MKSLKKKRRKKKRKVPGSQVENCKKVQDRQQSVKQQNRTSLVRFLINH